MMNYANDINVYQIWANMVCYDQGYFNPEQRPYSCCHAGQRKGNNFKHSKDEIFAKYGQNIMMYEEMADVLAGAMGNYVYLARFGTEEEVFEFVNYVFEKQ